MPWCPDDYCKKPLPPTYCVPPGCKDDYCKKPLPPTYCVPPGCKDDYCKKPLPACPAIGAGICGPGDGCCKSIALPVTARASPRLWPLNRQA